MSRYASIWFPYLLTEFAARKKPQLRDTVFVLASPQRGRMVIDSVSIQAAQKDIHPGMVVADCKAIFPELEILKSESGQTEKVLNALAEWCIGYTPLVSIDLPDGLILDINGCAHLWGGENKYLENIKLKLRGYGYTVRIAIADTVGTAWAMARFSNHEIVKPGMQYEVLQKLPPAALRIEAGILAKLRKLGLQRIENFMKMPPTVLRRRFGSSLSFRIAQALGSETEIIIPIKPVEPYQERLCSMEAIATATGISIALKKLLESLCIRFEAEGMGLRNGIFRAYRVDGNIQQIEIGTSRPSRNEAHLFKLFEHKIATLEPELGFEMFVLEAPKIELISSEQSAIWTSSSQNDKKVAELLDRIAVKTGMNAITRYLPAEHYWPERSMKQAVPLWEQPATAWRTDWMRPIHLLKLPEPVEVTATLPDYPPMLFRYKGKRYNVVKSDGPERIEQEWWLADGLYRDYYCVQDESGARYWLFRSGPYDTDHPKWFLHGFFA